VNYVVILLIGDEFGMILFYLYESRFKNQNAYEDVSDFIRIKLQEG